MKSSSIIDRAGKIGGSCNRGHHTFLGSRKPRIVRHTAFSTPKHKGLVNDD